MKRLLALAMLAAASVPSFAQDNLPPTPVFCAPGTPLCVPIAPIRTQMASPAEECKKNDQKPSTNRIIIKDASTTTHLSDEAGGIKQPCNA